MIDAMNVLTKPRMTVSEFLAWAADRPGRHELFRGEVIKMSPETVGHLEAKAAIYDALRAAVRASGTECHVLPDGATVRIDDATAYEPNALIYCGQRLPPSAIEIPSPVVVVEVLPPSTRNIDTALKLEGYFTLASIMHYLVVDPARRTIVHHARGSSDFIVTRVVTEGVVALDPPGLTLALTEVFGPTA